MTHIYTTTQTMHGMTDIFVLLPKNPTRRKKKKSA